MTECWCAILKKNAFCSLVSCFTHQCNSNYVLQAAIQSSSFPGATLTISWKRPEPLVRGEQKEDEENLEVEGKEAFIEQEKEEVRNCTTCK